MLKQKIGNLFPGIGAVEVHPQQIGGFELWHTDGGEALCEEISQQEEVAVNQSIHLLQPGRTFFGVCCLKGNDSKLIHIAVLPDVDHPVHPGAEILICRNDVGNLDAGDVEVLGRGDEGYAVLRELL